MTYLDDGAFAQHVVMNQAGLAHDRSSPRERQARSSAARSCAPRPSVLGAAAALWVVRGSYLRCVARGTAGVICDGTKVESRISCRARAKCLQGPSDWHPGPFVLGAAAALRRCSLILGGARLREPGRWTAPLEACLPAGSTPLDPRVPQ